MRSYHQYCALARALDVVGERWTLLIVRELFAGDCRYSDLRDSLPGIASNLLADRLRHLQTEGIIAAYDASRPVRATVYRLTDRGRELGPALGALAAWGALLVTDGQGEDTFRTHWLALGLPRLFDGVDVADLAPLTVRIETGDEPATLQVTKAGVTIDTGTSTAPHAEVVVRGEPEAVFAVLTATTGSKSTAEVQGPREVLRRLRTLGDRSRLADTRGASR